MFFSDLGYLRERQIVLASPAPQWGLDLWSLVNHNRSAGLMEMLVPIPLVLSLTRFASPRARTAAAAVAALNGGHDLPFGIAWGMLAIIVEIVILAVLLVKQKRNLRTAVLVGVFFTIVVGFVIWIGGDAVGNRWASVNSSHSEISSDVRLNIDRDGVSDVPEKACPGMGLGNISRGVSAIPDLLHQFLR